MLRLFWYQGYALGWGRGLALAGLFAVFALVIAILHDSPRVESIARAYLMLLPLATAALAPAFILDDPLGELQLAAPRPLRQLVFVRIGLLTLFAGIGAALFWILLRLIAPTAAAPTYAWADIAPSLAFAVATTALAFAAREALAGAAVAGLVWLGQLLYGGLFLATAPGRGLYLFMGVEYPGAPFLTANQLGLLGLGVVAAGACWRLARREERYL